MLYMKAIKGRTQSGFVEAQEELQRKFDAAIPEAVKNPLPGMSPTSVSETGCPQNGSGA